MVSFGAGVQMLTSSCRLFFWVVLFVDIYHRWCPYCFRLLSRDSSHQIVCWYQLGDTLLFQVCFLLSLCLVHGKLALSPLLLVEVHFTSIPTLALSPPPVFRKAAAIFLTLEFSRWQLVTGLCVHQLHWSVWLSQATFGRLKVGDSQGFQEILWPL